MTNFRSRTRTDFHYSGFFVTYLRTKLPSNSKRSIEKLLQYLSIVSASKTNVLEIGESQSISSLSWLANIRDFKWCINDNNKYSDLIRLLGTSIVSKASMAYERAFVAWRLPYQYQLRGWSPPEDCEYYDFALIATMVDLDTLWWSCIDDALNWFSADVFLTISTIDYIFPVWIAKTTISLRVKVLKELLAKWTMFLAMHSLSGGSIFKGGIFYMPPLYCWRLDDEIFFIISATETEEPIPPQSTIKDLLFGLV